MTARDILRKQMLDSILEKMSDEERRSYMLLTAANDNQRELMSALQEQGLKLDAIGKKQSWLSDFSANITANAAWDTIIYFASRILKNIK